MPGDYTRFLFDAFKDYASVLMQQGRVLLDSDWNEIMDILARRLRAETVDIIGHCIVPKETIHGFEITLVGGDLLIGQGRMYVEGLLAENHGLKREFDKVLDEIRGSDPIPYEKQPYFPNVATVAPLPTAGTFLVYIDVWRRELTYLQDLKLVDSAVGVDTTTRIQTAWQVKLLAVDSGVACATPDASIPAWVDLIRPTGGRLTTAAVGAPASTDPCILPPNAGFRGKENRLYRVEIHDPGPIGTATFKFSRDDASDATVVTATNAGRDVLTVNPIGRDASLRFRAGDWLEITDDFHELTGQPGVMRKVQSTDDVNRTVTLTSALAAGEFDPTNLTRHMRAIRWDQTGPAVDATGGLLPVTAAPMVLEDGVQVTFSVDATVNNSFKSGDYWTFAARTADASVEILNEAPPRGIYHHFCRLALLTFPGPPIDCRTFWPPDTPAADNCECTVCVTPQSHNSGALTIQAAVNQVRITGGKICLQAGQYQLQDTVQITGARSVRITGKGFVTQILSSSSQPAFNIERSLGITIEELAILQTNRDAQATIRMRNDALCTLRRLTLLAISRSAAAINLNGFQAALRIEDNLIAAFNGITGGTAAVTGAVSFVLTWDLRIRDNIVLAFLKGISFEGFSAHADTMSITGNVLYLCSQGAISTVGIAVNGSPDISGNEIRARGTGVVTSLSGSRIEANDITTFFGNNSAAAIGIVPVAISPKQPIDSIEINRNRITNAGQQGILVTARLNSLKVHGNTIERASAGALVIQQGGGAVTVTVTANHFSGIGLQTDNPDLQIAAVRFFLCGTVICSDNVLSYAMLPISGNFSNARRRAGIQASGCQTVKIMGNSVEESGPFNPNQPWSDSVGIEVTGGFNIANISNNTVVLSASIQGPAPWVGIRIGDSFNAAGNIAPAPVGNGAFVRLDATTLLFATTVGLFSLPIGNEHVSIRGNQVEGNSTTNLVLVSLDRVPFVTFGENQCLPPEPTNVSVPPVSILAGQGGITVSNNIVGGQVAPTSVSMTLAALSATVLGNLTAATITLNGAALGAPFAALNIKGN